MHTSPLAAAEGKHGIPASWPRRRISGPLKKNTPYSFETSGTDFPVARRQIPDERSSQKNYFENLKTCTYGGIWVTQALHIR